MNLPKAMIGSIAVAVTGPRHRIAHLETPGRNISAANWFTLEAIRALSASGAPTGAFQGRVTRWARMSRGEHDQISVRAGRRSKAHRFKLRSRLSTWINGYSIDTAKTRIFHARRRLKSLLAERGEEAA